jgi:hypothetical protein
MPAQNARIHATKSALSTRKRTEQQKGWARSQARSLQLHAAFHLLSLRNQQD